MTTIAMATTSMSKPHLKLTRRGRVVVTTLAAIPFVVMAVIAGLNAGGAAATGDISSTQFSYVSVAPGQSLWQLASEIAPSSDPREVVARIVALNQLPSADVQPGERLAIPSEYAG